MMYLICKLCTCLQVSFNCILQHVKQLLIMNVTQPCKMMEFRIKEIKATYSFQDRYTQWRQGILGPYTQTNFSNFFSTNSQIMLTIKRSSSFQNKKEWIYKQLKHNLVKLSPMNAMQQSQHNTYITYI